jgi:hypothetical protein
MTASAIAAAVAASSPTRARTQEPIASDYRPGLCNIGPAEIERRRRAGHLGVASTALLLIGLVLIDAPPIARLLVVFPAAAAAAGYLQAWLKFCAGFGARGVFNFGKLGHTEQVGDAASRPRDRAKATQIALASLAVGVLVALAAMLI